MESLDDQIAKLSLTKNCALSSEVYSESPNTEGDSVITGKMSAEDINLKKIGPAVPPKPNKKNTQFAEVPQGAHVRQTCEPVYSKHSGVNFAPKDNLKKAPCTKPLFAMDHNGPPHMMCRHHAYANTKVTLDNPAILDQQLEALEHHKRQLEKKGLLQSNLIPKLSSASLSSVASDPYAHGNPTKSHLYSNVNPGSNSLGHGQLFNRQKVHEVSSNPYSNIHHKPLSDGETIRDGNYPYSNVDYGDNVDDLPPPPPLEALATLSITETVEHLTHCPTADDEIPPPPSPVSSSYSELRRATDTYPKLPSYSMPSYPANVSNKTFHGVEMNTTDNQRIHQPSITGCQPHETQQTYVNMSYNHTDCGTYGSPSSQGSSTYESIYEPINPRPPSQMSSRSNYLSYNSYVNGPQPTDREATIGANATVPESIGLPPTVNINGKPQSRKEAEVEALTDLLVHTMESGNDTDSFGICIACNQRVVGENSGCTAMEQVYHIACFTCSQCQINLQGKPFYALDGKPYCEVDYLNTLEKCSVCMKPILERILRATGKPYHPQCFTCVVCGNSLDGIPFTVDATNQNYCIADFHKKFAPRCCVCKLPIMPEPGQEETVRVVALDRSFHFECYKCEDCGLLLSSEAEGRGCYPLDDHVLCKSCNAKRVQTLTSCMTTEL